MVMYFYWRAYDNLAREYNGVMEADKFELVAIKIIQDNLTPALIQSIEYDQYRKLNIIYKRISMMNKLKLKVNNDNQEMPQNRNHLRFGIILTLILFLCLSSVLLYLLLP